MKRLAMERKLNLSRTVGSERQALGAHSRFSSLSPVIPREFLWMVDVFSICASFGLSYELVPSLFQLLRDFLESLVVFVPSIIRPLQPLGSKAELLPPTDLFWLVGVFTIASTLVLSGGGIYSHPVCLSKSRIVVVGVVAALSSLSSSSLIVFLTRLKTSRLFLVLMTALVAFSFVTTRLAIRYYVQRRFESGQYRQNLVTVGPLDSVSKLSAELVKLYKPYEYSIVAEVKLADGAEMASEGANNSFFQEDLRSRLVHIFKNREVTQVAVVQPVATGCPWLRDVVQVCDELGIALTIVPEVFLFWRTTNIRSASNYESQILPSVTLLPHRLRDLEKIFIKRLVDVLISSALLVILSPLIIIIATAIRISSESPVFYKWNVIGYNGKKFVSYKFRTMVPNADAIKNDLQTLNEMKGPVFKLKDDPRITPLGRLLRKYSLDELPQLYSVLKGDMSMVGPRPVFSHELEHFEFWHIRKLSVRSGITCLWQVSGRNKIQKFDDWVRLDLEYIDKWSLWLDFKIMAKTTWAVLTGTGR